MGQHPDFYNNITRRGWRNFCTLPMVTREDICKEFFANSYMEEEEGVEKQFVSFVRGKEIKYDSLSIQSLLKTALCDRTSVTTCIFQNKCHALEYDEDELEAAKAILECITNPGEMWDKIKDERPKRVWLKNLNNPAKVWYHFVVGNIMPSSNHTEVVVKRAVLIWAIMTERPIDLPRILSESLYDMAHTNSKKASIGHSSLIQYMCQAAGVEIPTTGGREITLLPTINAKWISDKLKQPVEEDGSIAEAAQAGRRRRARRTPAQEDEASGSAAGGAVESRLTLKTQVGFIRRRNRHMQGQQLAYQTHILRYLSITQPDGLPVFQPEPYDG